MALPVILIDSATGSDTAASGAGPAMAVTGSAGVSAGDGLSVVVDAFTDISGVATDGSAVFYFADATAGNRNFAKITGSSGSGGTTPTFTLANALGATLTKAWAVGGKRASIGSTTSSKLIEKNSAAGDALPGWIIELQSAHSETLAATLTFRALGDITTGYITLRGVSGAGTLPLLTFSNNGVAIQFVGSNMYWVLQDFELQNSNGTKTASYAVSTNGGGFTRYVQISGLKISHSTNKFWRGIGWYYSSGINIVGCTIGYCADWGLGNFTGGSNDSGLNFVAWNYIHHCTSHGIILDSGANESCMVRDNILAYNGGKGIQVATGPNSFIGNTIHASASDGIRITGSAAGSMVAMTIDNNILSYNGGYGINYSGSPASGILSGPYFNNLFYTNTSGKYSPSGLNSINESTVNPSGGLTSATKDYAGTTDGGNFAIASAAKALGYPLGGVTRLGKYSTTYSYVDPGAAQRQEPASTPNPSSLFNTHVRNF